MAEIWLGLELLYVSSPPSYMHYVAGSKGRPGLGKHSNSSSPTPTPISALPVWMLGWTHSVPSHPSYQAVRLHFQIHLSLSGHTLLSQEARIKRSDLQTSYKRFAAHRGEIGGLVHREGISLMLPWISPSYAHVCRCARGMLNSFSSLLDLRGN